MSFANRFKEGRQNVHGFLAKAFGYAWLRTIKYMPNDIV